MDINNIVNSLRAAAQESGTLVSRSWRNYHLLSASLRSSFPDNPRVENLIATLRSRLEDAVGDIQAGDQPNLKKLMTVFDEIEFHLYNLVQARGL